MRTWERTAGRAIPCCYCSAMLAGLGTSIQPTAPRCASTEPRYTITVQLHESLPTVRRDAYCDAAAGCDTPQWVGEERLTQVDRNKARSVLTTRDAVVRLEG